MKNLFPTLILSLLVLAGSNLTGQQTMSKLAFYSTAEAAVAVTSPKAELGQIPQGVPVTHTFELKNTGSEPLILTNVSKPCGCQQAKWTQEPIMPGETGTVEATYNAAKMGSFMKSFTVHHNGAGQTMNLVLSGEVVKEAKLKDNVADSSL